MALFRRRHELEKMAAAEAEGASFWTRKFSKEARVKILHAFRNAAEAQPQAPFIAHRMILEDEGRLGLGHSPNYEPDDLAGHILNAPDDEVASAIEACVAALFESDRAECDYPTYHAMNDFHQRVETILADHRLSFELNAGTMVPFESRAMHAEVVAPTLRLLSTGKEWDEVEKAYRDALGEIADRKPADAITDAGRALQKALELVGAEGNALGPLIASARKKGLLASHDTKLGDGIESLLNWVSADRSELGEAHHGGTDLLEDAWLAIQVVGALILRLSGTPRSAS